MFNGPIYEAGAFFSAVGFPCKENYNPADHFVWQTSVHEGQEESSKKKILAISESYEKYPVFAEIKAWQLPEKSTDDIVTQSIQERAKNKASTMTAFIWLLWRSLISTVSMFSLDIGIFSFYTCLLIYCLTLVLRLNLYLSTEIAQLSE